MRTSDAGRGRGQRRGVQDSVVFVYTFVVICLLTLLVRFICCAALASSLLQLFVSLLSFAILLTTLQVWVDRC